MIDWLINGVAVNIWIAVSIWINEDKGIFHSPQFLGWHRLIHQVYSVAHNGPRKWKTKLKNTHSVHKNIKMCTAHSEPCTVHGSVGTVYIVSRDSGTSQPISVFGGTGNTASVAEYIPAPCSLASDSLDLECMWGKQINPHFWIDFTIGR